MSVVFSGDILAIEFRDGLPRKQVKITPGQVDWDEPSDRVHRAVNIGDGPYEEITVFFLAHPDDVPMESGSLLKTQLPIQAPSTLLPVIRIGMTGSQPLKPRIFTSSPRSVRRRTWFSSGPVSSSSSVPATPHRGTRP